MTLNLYYSCVLIYLIAHCSSLKPVVLVPGLGGSQFEAKLNKTETVHYWCTKTSDWYLLWLSVEQLFFAADCMVDNMKLNYDPELRITQNQPGVQIRQPGFGDTQTIEYLDPSHPIEKATFEYFDDIVEMLFKNFNYTRNVTVRGAPYDFRKAPNEMNEYFQNLTNLIESTYYFNGNTRIILVGHSMGNNYILYLLNNAKQSWKDKFIDSFVSISAPWAGSVKPLALIASGDTLGQSTHIINPIQARPLQQSMPSTAWLMPYDTHWAEYEVLIVAPTGNYTVKDYKQFTADVEYPNSFLMRQDNEPLIKGLKHPGVQVHLIYGLNCTTPAQYNYKSVWERNRKKCYQHKLKWFNAKKRYNDALDLDKRQSSNNWLFRMLEKPHEDVPFNYIDLNDYFDFKKICAKRWFDYQPDIVTGDGDGTVNIRSLKAANFWKGATIFEVMGGEHLKILHDKQMLDHLKDIIAGRL